MAVPPYRRSTLPSLPYYRSGLPSPPYSPRPHSQRPSWAVDEPFQPFKELAPLLTLEHAVLINTPFAGMYYTSPRDQAPQHNNNNRSPQVALAVFARFTPSSYSARNCFENMWVAVREIHTWPDEREHRRFVELTWMPWVNCIKFLGTWGYHPGYQIFEPKQQFQCQGIDCEPGALSVRKVYHAWARDNAFDEWGRTCVVLREPRSGSIS